MPRCSRHRARDKFSPESTARKTVAIRAAGGSFWRFFPENPKIHRKSPFSALPDTLSGRQTKVWSGRDRGTSTTNPHATLRSPKPLIAGGLAFLGSPTGRLFQVVSQPSQPKGPERANPGKSYESRRLLPGWQVPGFNWGSRRLAA